MSSRPVRRSTSLIIATTEPQHETRRMGAKIASVMLLNPSTIASLRTAKTLKQPLIVTFDGSTLTFHASE